MDGRLSQTFQWDAEQTLEKVVRRVKQPKNIGKQQSVVRGEFATKVDVDSVASRDLSMSKEL